MRRHSAVGRVPACRQAGRRIETTAGGVRTRYDALLADGLALQARWSQPEDVGKVVAAIARGDLPYSTGAIIPVDGGMGVPRL